MAKMGRPKKEINWDELDRLCAIHCTRQEIADWFGVHEDTIDNHCKEVHGVSFSVYYAQNKSKGKMSLRRRQYTKAMDGDTTMLLWLGKNWLDQSDSSRLELSRNEDNYKNIREFRRKLAKDERNRTKGDS